MNRTIKFKAWDKKNQKWLPPERVAITGDGEISFFGNMLNNWVDNHPGLTNKDVEIVKFTSLYDKNGKEIYEGDVVKIRGFFSHATIYIVKWAEAYSGHQWCLIDARGELSSFYGGIDERVVEVIGNRFEQDLLI
jgi:uncharacterized phage protein (TIGR01671 family)